MSSLMQQLHDIEGLDAISPWPLAIGWWISIVCGMLVLGSGLWLLRRRLNYLRSWKKDAFRKLDSLEQNLTPSTSKETIVFLSEYLRRIAMRRFPRKECAGLVGEAWLRWLRVHDPKQFDWTEKGKLLIEIPYAPAHRDLPLQQIKELIQAIRYWVHYTTLDHKLGIWPAPKPRAWPTASRFIFLILTGLRSTNRGNFRAGPNPNL